MSMMDEREGVKLSTADETEKTFRFRQLRHLSNNRCLIQDYFLYAISYAPQIWKNFLHV